MNDANDVRWVRRRTYAAPLWSADCLILRHIRSFVSPRLDRFVRAGTVVLDAGCGEQPLRKGIEAAGAAYVGLDVRQNRAGSVDVVASLTRVPRASESVDLIVCTEVLEHVPDTAAAFAELARLVRKDGVVLLTTPFSYPLHEEPHDYVRLTRHAITTLAERHGLIVTEVYALGNEVEVLAVTFGNLLSNALAPLPFVLRAAFALVRLPVNVAVNLAALVLGSLPLPRRSYLTTAAVLTRR
jgi:SAM-dependent methyltransferase